MLGISDLKISEKLLFYAKVDIIWEIIFYFPYYWREQDFSKYSFKF